MQKKSTNLACGIVGLPNVGKSTLFNALTSAKAASSNYPFCTIDPNVGIVEVADPRLEMLSELSKSARIIRATVEFDDIAGLVAGASKGEGLGNKFLANIRETDAIVHVVRCFDSEDIIHVSGRVDPLSDIGVINIELMLSDLESAENCLGRLEKQAKGKKELLPTVELLKRVIAHLNEMKPVRTLPMTTEEKIMLLPYPFLTAKKVLYAANISEDDLPDGANNPYVKQVMEYAAAEGNNVVTICCRLEEEIAQLPESERADFLKDLGLELSGLQKLIKASFDMLGLITFLTTGDIETRAWPIVRGMTAAEAAGRIHTDIQKGFIRAETISFDDMIKYKGRTGAKEAGRMRSEGRDYLVQDGDVMLFLHN